MSRNFLLILAILGLTLASCAVEAQTTPTSTQVVLPNNVSCSLHTDCSSCAADTRCQYCAYSGNFQGTGACQNRTDPYAYCSIYSGSTITQTYQCAEPWDSCANYNYGGSNTGCSTCSQAPLSLNCGWCADGINGQYCVAGIPSGPNSGYCLSASWGLQTASCSSAQATCNAYSGSNYGCSECLSIGGCGYCESTQRCETSTGAGYGPSAGDCQVNYTSIASQCPGASDPCNGYSSSCSECSIYAPAAWACGYCATTQTCQAGNTYGPFQGTCASLATGSSGWVPQAGTCTTPPPPPPPATCTNIGDCNDCTETANCQWCPSGSYAGCQLQGSYCGMSVIEQPNQCSPTPSPDNFGDDSFPDAGSAAVTMLAITSILMLIRLVLYLSARGWRPVFGSRLIAGQLSPRDYTGSLRVLPVILSLCSLAMKLTGMGLDTWDYDSSIGNYGGVVIEYHFGVLGVTVTDGEGDSNWTSYLSECQPLGDYGSSNDFAVCNIGRAAGILTLITGSLASIAAITLFVLSSYILCRRERFAMNVMKMWRWAGLTSLFTLATSAYWGWSGHMIVHHEDGSAILGVSWILFISSWVFDLINMIYYRNAVRHTIDPSRAQAPALLAYAPLSGAPAVMSHPVAQPVQAMPQQQYVYGAMPNPAMQYQYNQYAPVAGYQAQQGYQMPPQGYGNAQGQRYQAPVYATPVYGSGIQQA